MYSMVSTVFRVHLGNGFGMRIFASCLCLLRKSCMLRHSYRNLSENAKESCRHFLLLNSNEIKKCIVIAEHLTLIAHPEPCGFFYLVFAIAIYIGDSTQNLLLKQYYYSPPYPPHPHHPHHVLHDKKTLNLY